MASISNLRLVWFPLEHTSGVATRLFAEFCGAEPDRSSVSRQPSVHQPAIETAGGVWGDFDVEVQVQHGRIDMVVQPTQIGVVRESPVPPTVEASDILPKVLQGIRGVQTAIKASRLSVIAVALDLGKDLKEARDKFAAYIGYDFNVPEASDHFFQINRRATIEGVLCNRVVQLVVSEFQNLQISFVPGGSVQNVASASQALMLTLDFNTAPQANEIALDAQNNIFEGLFSEIMRANDRGNLDFLRDA